MDSISNLLTHDQWSLVWVGGIGFGIGAVLVLLYHIRMVEAMGRQLAHIVFNLSEREQVAYLKDIKNTIQANGKYGEKP